MTGEQGRVPTTEELLAGWRAVAEAAGRPPDDSAPIEDGAADVPGRHATSPPWDLAELAAAAVLGTTAVLAVGSAPVPESDGLALVRHEGGDAGPLPFPDRCVDVVVARDVPFDADEVARVLRPGGVLLAELVGGDDVVELYAVLGSPPPRPHLTPETCAAELLDAGLRVTRQEAWHGPLSFDDVGALVAHLARVPSHAPADFAVDGYANTLLYLHLRGPAWGQPLAFTQSRLLLRAERPS